MRYDAALLERVSQRFRYDMWKSVTPDAVTESGVEVKSFGPVQATAFGDLAEVTGLNQIQGAAEPGAIEGGHLAEAVGWMQSWEVDYRVPVAEHRPSTQEAEFWLSDRGYECGGGWTKMVREAAPLDLPANPDVTVFELGEDEADGEGLSSIIPEALELPITAGVLFFSLPQEERWRCYTAVVEPEGEIAAAGVMMIADGVAQIGLDTTLEHWRGRGCNTELIRRRMLDAVEAGCHTVFVELGEGDPENIAAAYRNLRRAGFEEAYRSRNWQRPALRPAEAIE